jgi:hypothetical protein
MSYTFVDPNRLFEFADKENTLFDEVKVLAVKQALKDIEVNFVPTAEQPVYDLFCMTAEYNKLNVGQEINGTTTDFCFNYGN